MGRTKGLEVLRIPEKVSIPSMGDLMVNVSLRLTPTYSLP
jgi:hypothetical protein